MKRKISLAVSFLLILLSILFLPLPISPARDGGTRMYRAIIYTVVEWNRLYEEDGTPGKYQNTDIYWFCGNASYEELWEIEKDNHLSEHPK